LTRIPLDMKWQNFSLSMQIFSLFTEILPRINNMREIAPFGVWLPDCNYPSKESSRST
jgi:hypothetical protein